MTHRRRPVFFCINLALDAARDRQETLRRAAERPRLASRPVGVRRRVGAWIVRLGQSIAGAPDPAPVRTA
jgi:hypothetical protein